MPRSRERTRPRLLVLERQPFPALQRFGLPSTPKGSQTSLSLSCPWRLTQSQELALRNPGPPRWLSGKESTCQCRRHRFDPWSGRIPHAAGQLSPCATTTESLCPRAHRPTPRKPERSRAVCSAMRKATAVRSLQTTRVAPICHNQKKVHAATKTQHSQINKQKLLKNKQKKKQQNK